MTEDDATDKLRARLDHHWQLEVKKRPESPSLTRAFARVFLPRFLWMGLMGVIGDASPPLYYYLTKRYIDFLGDPTAPTSEGIPLVAGFSVLLIITLLFRHYASFHAVVLGIAMRKALTALLFGKLLKLSQASVARASPGKLVNMASGDMAVIERGSIMLPYLAITPFAAVGCLVAMYFLVGPLVFYSLIFVIVAYFLQFPVNAYLVRSRLGIAQATDRRLNVLNKLILGIRTIKTYAWEAPTIAAARAARKVECSRLLSQILVRGFANTLFSNASVLLWLLVILAKVYTGEPLEASSIFTAMSLLGMLGIITINFFSLSMNSVAEMLAVLSRLQQVLLLPELTEKQAELPPSAPRIQAQRARTTWGFLVDQPEGNTTANTQH